MTAVRFFFDECLSRPVVEGILTDSLRLFGSDAEVAHLLPKFGAHGLSDRHWVEQLVSEGSWIAISADRGKHSKLSDKLPLICQEVGLTLVMLSAKLHQRNMAFKLLAIQSVWQDLHDLRSEPPGSLRQLCIFGSGFRLQKYPATINPPIPHPPKSDDGDPMLFDA